MRREFYRDVARIYFFLASNTYQLVIKVTGTCLNFACGTLLHSRRDAIELDSDRLVSGVAE